MTSEIQFIDGLVVQAPRENAPDYVKARIWIKREELIAFLQSQTGESINADVKVSQGGKWYAAVDNWKPQNGNGPRQATARREAPKATAQEYDDSDSIPFVTSRGVF